MGLKVAVVSKEEWSNCSEDAHRAVFGRVKSVERDRFDYVLLAVLDEKPFGYIMVREVDSEEVYWQFGGAFQWARNSIRIGKVWDVTISEQFRIGVQRIGFRVDRENLPMIKLALSRKFMIGGTREFRGKILVEFAREISDGNSTQFHESVER